MKMPLSRSKKFSGKLMVNWKMAVIISDGNKTKMLRRRPRPVKQQQEYITEKTSVATCMFVIKK